MGLDLSADEVAALEDRTEGWIAGLQLAALSLQGRADAAGFIASFTGSHRFVLDYLVEEVLQRQPDARRRRSCCGRPSSIACAAPCAMPCWLDARRRARRPSSTSSAPTCSSSPSTTSGAGTATTTSSPTCCGSGAGRARSRPGGVDEDHLRASEWYEANGLESKPSSMQPPATTSSGPSASSRARACPCTFAAR